MAENGLSHKDVPHNQVHNSDASEAEEDPDEITNELIVEDLDAIVSLLLWNVQKSFRQAMHQLC